MPETPEEHAPAAPPLEASVEGVLPHPPHTGRRWIDFTIAGTAILISLVSLGVGFENARSEQQMVAASSWPFLVYNSEHTGPTINMRITNEGQGTARLISVNVKYHGQSANGVRELLHICCGLPKEASWESVTSSGLRQESRLVGVHAPGEVTDMITIDRTPENAAMWDKLLQAA